MLNSMRKKNLRGIGYMIYGTNKSIWLTINSIDNEGEFLSFLKFLWRENKRLNDFLCVFFLIFDILNNFRFKVG